ncbi:MAG: hypothetical protein MUF34_20450 [Polyangiaceae bacterium]|jgi:hypothetical protein|nr:hypothetical protein [Polyangiaceae bacterium]
MPPRYLIDSNVIIDFQQGGRLKELVAAAKAVPLAIVEQVFTEVAVPEPGEKQARADEKRSASKSLLDGAVQVVVLQPGTPAENLYATLVKTHGRGEAASISFALYEGPDCVFVTGDGPAAILALNELSDGTERVMRVPVLVRRLYEAGALEASVVHAVALRVISHGLEPSWWATWLAGLPPYTRYDRDL